MPTRLETLQIPRHHGRLVSFVKTNIGFDIRCLDPQRSAHVGANFTEEVAKRGDTIRSNFNACGGLMTTETHELAATAIERIVERKTHGTTHGTTARETIQSGNDRGLAVLGSDASRDDPDDADMPSFTRQHDRRLGCPATTLDVLLGLNDHLFLNRTTLQRELLEMRGDSIRPRTISFEQQRERKVWIRKSSRRIESWRDAEGDIIGGDTVHEIELSEVGKCAQTRPQTQRKSRKARTYERTVVTDERSNIRNRSNRDEVEPRAHVQLGTKRATYRSSKRQRQTARRQMLERKTAFGSMRIQKCERRQRFVRDEVMIDDDHIHARRTSIREPLVITRPTITRDEKLRARCLHARQRRRTQAVPTITPRCEQRRHTPTQRAQYLRHDRA